MLASHGYVVLLPNPRGSAGQGNEFARGVKDGWGSKDYQDVADGIDMLVARKIADPSRLGIGGWKKWKRVGSGKSVTVRVGWVGRGLIKKKKNIKKKNDTYIT